MPNKYTIQTDVFKVDVQEELDRVNEELEPLVTRKAELIEEMKKFD